MIMTLFYVLPILADMAPFCATPSVARIANRSIRRIAMVRRYEYDFEDFLARILKGEVHERYLYRLRRYKIIIMIMIGEDLFRVTV